MKADLLLSGLPTGAGDAAAVTGPGALESLAGELQDLDMPLQELLIASSVGFRVPDQVPPLLHGTGETIGELAARARSAGLLLPSGRPVPVVEKLVRKNADLHQVRRFQRSLVDTLCSEGLPLLEVARDFVQEGLTDRRVAQALESAAHAALATEPELALTLFNEAVAAGADELATAAPRAEAAAATGDLDGACRILDDLLASNNSPVEPGIDPGQPGEAPDLERAVHVAAAVWAQRGMMSRAADVYRWFGPASGTFSALAAVALTAAGDSTGARNLLSTQGPGGSPTLCSVAASLMGEGAMHSLETPPSRAVPTLIRASDTLTASGRSLPAPEGPASFAAIVALSAGEPDTASSVLAAALEGGQGGQAQRPRLLLLSAWAAMVQDRPPVAWEAILEARGAVASLVPRDELLAQALEVGLARRTGDTTGMIDAWQRASEAVLHVSIDLFSLLPLGELMIAAARLRDSHKLEPHVAEAWALLARLGDPPLWAVPLHWSAIHAALLLERPADLAPHASALVRASGQYPLAAVLAAAGRTWVSVLAGKFDTDAVESAARALAAAGLPWDGARLAGHASARAQDRKDMARLLACARDLRPDQTRADASTPEPGTAAGRGIREESREAGRRSPASKTPKGSTHAPRPLNESELSGREREIAQLVLEGRTYREISAAIFISPRTVEHHIARIRRRLGVANRSDLLARLRLILGGSMRDNPLIP
ncbi:LuxR C-terminal-related transcriptional regulator [Arthrobacter sp. Br18]|uniref:LuxR C-terminal-related transcriptional regulator n=1 Tax=Arthrobacter sp. Br18 TaxID=1312954 RepID=UPI0004B62B01|nr:LuxR C-terminal-related transcriptional regulator [Arthrobacter sp. Br18]